MNEWMNEWTNCWIILIVVNCLHQDIAVEGWVSSACPGQYCSRHSPPRSVHSRLLLLYLLNHKVLWNTSTSLSSIARNYGDNMTTFWNKWMNEWTNERIAAITIILIVVNCLHQDIAVEGWVSSACPGQYCSRRHHNDAGVLHLQCGRYTLLPIW